MALPRRDFIGIIYQLAVYVVTVATIVDITS